MASSRGALNAAIGAFSDDLRKFSSRVTDGVAGLKRAVESKPLGGGTFL